MTALVEHEKCFRRRQSCFFNKRLKSVMNFDPVAFLLTKKCSEIPATFQSVGVQVEQRSRWRVSDFQYFFRPVTSDSRFWTLKDPSSSKVGLCHSR